MQLLGYFGALLLLSCSQRTDTTEKMQGVKSIKIKQIIPTLDSSGNVFSIDTSIIQFYYFKNKILYKIESRYADQTTTNYNTLKIRYSYFCTSDSGKSGYFFASTDLNNTKFTSDNSPVRNEWFENVDLDKLFSGNNLLLLKSENFMNNSVLHEYYGFRDKVDTSFKRTAHLYFKKEKSTLYAKPTYALNIRKGMRLIRCDIYTPKQYSKEMREIINEYTVTYLIEDVELTQTEQDKIAKYFK